MPIKGAFLLAFFVGSIPFCFIKPFYGLLLWTVIAFLNPQSYILYWEAAANFPWAVAVGAPTILGCILFCRGWFSRLASREFVFLVALWVWFTVTTLVSVHTDVFRHHAEDTWYRWSFVSKILLMTAFTMGIVNSFARLRILVITVCTCFGFFIVKSLPFVIATGGEFRVYGPPNSMVADNNDFGLAMNMTVPLFFGLAQSEEKRWAKWLCGALCLMAIPAGLFTYSRGAVVGLCAVLMLMWIRMKQRLALAVVIVVALGFGLSFAPRTWKTRMDPTRPNAVDSSARSRLYAWEYARNLAADYPIAGGGFATFTPELFARYSPKMSYAYGPHSIYFQLLAEHGYIGLGLYLAFVGSLFATAGRLVREAREKEAPILAQYANMFRFSLVGFLTSGIFLGRAYFDYFFLIAACLAILKRLAQEEVPEFEDTEDPYTIEDPHLAGMAAAATEAQ